MTLLVTSKSFFSGALGVSPMSGKEARAGRPFNTVARIDVVADARENHESAFTRHFDNDFSDVSCGRSAPFGMNWYGTGRPRWAEKVGRA